MDHLSQYLQEGAKFFNIEATYSIDFVPTLNTIV